MRSLHKVHRRRAHNIIPHPLLIIISLHLRSALKLISLASRRQESLCIGIHISRLQPLQRICVHAHNHLARIVKAIEDDRVEGIVANEREDVSVPRLRPFLVASFASPSSTGAGLEHLFVASLAVFVRRLAGGVEGILVLDVRDGGLCSEVIGLLVHANVLVLYLLEVEISLLTTSGGSGGAVVSIEPLATTLALPPTLELVGFFDVRIREHLRAHNRSERPSTKVRDLDALESDHRLQRRVERGCLIAPDCQLHQVARRVANCEVALAVWLVCILGNQVRELSHVLENTENVHSRVGLNGGEL